MIEKLSVNQIYLQDLQLGFDNLLFQLDGASPPSNVNVVTYVDAIFSDK